VHIYEYDTLLLTENYDHVNTTEAAAVAGVFHSAACRRLEITPAAGDAAATTNVGNGRRERGCPDEELAELDQDSGAARRRSRRSTGTGQCAVQHVSESETVKLVLLLSLDS